MCKTKNNSYIKDTLFIEYITVLFENIKNIFVKYLSDSYEYFLKYDTKIRFKFSITSLEKIAFHVYSYYV